MGKVIAAAAYCNGRKVADIRIDESSQWATRPDHFVWIGFEAPDENDLRLLQDQFGLPELAIEDALHAHQRPKIETYGETTFVALRTAFLAEGHIAFGETEIFVGRGYVISVRHGGSASYAPVRQRAEASPKRLAHGEDYVLYAIVDFIADNYLTVVEKLADEIEALEDHVLEPLEEGRIYRIYELRRELQRLRLAAAPAVEVCSRLEHAELPGIDKESQPYFRDVGDHVRRALEQIDMLREMLGFAFEAGMLMESSRQSLEASRQSAISRQLAGWAAILAVLLGVATACSILFVRFRRAGWI